MDIRKKDNYKPIFILFLSAIVTLNACASDKNPAQILIDSYKLPDKLTLDVAEKVISDLDQAIEVSTDSNLKFRIGYRIAMLYFKTDRLDKACDYFTNISRLSDCPDLIKLCSLNMSGQICRMQARHKESLDIFEELIVLSKKFLPKDINEICPSTVLKLSITAGFSKAEIYQYQQQYDSAVSEYKRIIAYLEYNKIFNTDSYMSLAMDRISQLDLMRSDIEGFCRTATQLVEKFPNYYRVPLIRFETEAVKALNMKNTAVAFPKGSFEASVKLISFIKETNDKELTQKIVALLEKLSREYQGTYGGILLGYHYAWLLDVIGQSQTASKAFEVIHKNNFKDTSDNPCAAAVINTITDYARLQKAIILGETGNYKEALECVYSNNVDPNDTHSSVLADSIQKALETLKREVPKDVNDQ
jgi:tetratricopeptide (TPR) repeat protein